MKKSAQFFCGGVTVLVIVGLISTVLAVSGLVSYNEVSLILFEDTKISAGEEMTGQNGQMVPSSITYTDAVGGKTNYLPVRKIAEIFDSPISWDAKTSAVVLGNKPSGSTVVIGNPGEQAPAKPGLSDKANPFTEIEPSEIDTSLDAIALQNSAKIQSENGFSQRFTCFPDGYLMFTVTNNGATTLNMNVMRPITIGLGAYQGFHTVKIDPGKQVTRAFKLSAEAEELTCTLELEISSGAAQSLTDVTFSVTEFRPYARAR